MKLYTVQVAPNPSKVELFLAEREASGARFKLERVTVKLMKGEQRLAAHLARNPFGTLPVLELSDGEYIIESLPIIDYLDEISSGPALVSMWGETPKVRAKNRMLERIADLRVLVPLARYIHATNSPLGLPVNEAVAAQAHRVIPAGLDYLEAVLAAGCEYFGGEQPAVADCTLAAACQFARFAGYDLLGNYTQLTNWDRRFRLRKSAQSVLLK